MAPAGQASAPSRGYQLTNTIFEDTTRAVLYQNGQAGDKDVHTLDHRAGEFMLALSPSTRATWMQENAIASQPVTQRRPS